MDNPHVIYTLGEVAKLLRIDASIVWRMRRRGDLHAVKVRGRVLVPVAEVRPPAGGRGTRQARCHDKRDARMLTERLGAKIKRTREAKRMTQPQLAAVSGVTVQTICKLESVGARILPACGAQPQALVERGPRRDTQARDDMVHTARLYSGSAKGVRAQGIRS